MALFGNLFMFWRQHQFAMARIGSTNHVLLVIFFLIIALNAPPLSRFDRNAIPLPGPRQKKVRKMREKLYHHSVLNSLPTLSRCMALAFAFSCYKSCGWYEMVWGLGVRVPAIPSFTTRNSHFFTLGSGVPESVEIFHRGSPKSFEKSWGFTWRCEGVLPPMWEAVAPRQWRSARALTWRRGAGGRGGCNEVKTPP